AIDTSSAACSVALLQGGRVFSQYQLAPMQHTKIILKMIKTVMAEANLSLRELDAITYTVGPGSFTGIRIGSCVAQGIAFVHQLPIIGISSLQALAQTAFLKQGYRHSLICVDARMDQVYWANYQINAQGLAELSGQEQFCKPENIIFECPDKNLEWVGLGDGF